MRQWNRESKRHRERESQRKRVLGEREMGKWRMIESEREKRQRANDRKREGCSSSSSPQYHLRGRKQPSAKSFLMICSISADPTLFSLKIAHRKHFKFYTTCPPSPVVERNFLNLNNTRYQIRCIILWSRHHLLCRKLKNKSSYFNDFCWVH